MAPSALLDELHDFVQTDVHLPCFRQEGIDPLDDDLEPIAPGQGGTGIRDVSAARSTLDHDPRQLQLAVGPHNRIRIHQKLLGQDTDRRKLLSRRQPARSNEVFDLIHDLQIDRDAVGLRYVDLHVAFSLYQYIDTSRAAGSQAAS